MQRRVLVIDDDPLVGGTVLTLLKRQGYKVDAVLNGPDAIEKVREEVYDLVISDIRMPGMNGIQTIEAIQKICRELGRRCGFMFITGYAEEASPENAIRFGITDFLLKPLDLEQFLHAVEKNIGLPVV